MYKLDRERGVSFNLAYVELLLENASRLPSGGGEDRIELIEESLSDGKDHIVEHTCRTSFG